MHQSTIELLQHLDAARAGLRAVRDAVPEPLRERRPAADRWSLANVLSHLARTEAQVAALLKRKLRRALAEAPLPAASASGSVLASVDEARLLDRGQRFVAPDTAQPEVGQSADDAWSQLEVARRTTREVLLAADGLHTDGLKAPHPLLGELTFHQWFVFLGLHERRHAAQIEELAAQLQA